jgi:HupE / UreJ protein
VTNVLLGDEFCQNRSSHNAAEKGRRAAWRWLFNHVLQIGMIMLCCLGFSRQLSAHTFTTIVADLLQDDQELSMTMGLTILDAVAIIHNTPTSAGATLTHSQLISGLPIVQAYLAKKVRLSVNGVPISGACLGFIPDLVDPPKPGQPLAELLPDRLPFLMTWTLPPGTKQGTFTFDLLVDVVGSGVVHANLHQGDNIQSQFADLGASVTFEFTPVVAAVIQPITTGDSIDVTPAVVKTGGTEVKVPLIPSPSSSSTSGMTAGHLVTMGFKHIVPEGLDHMLFVICLFLLSPKLKPLLIQITAFTCAHSVTLGLAMVGWVLLPSRLVETIIALSIVVMAVENIISREVKPWRWMLVFGFGLIHGLGFAGSFSQLQLSEGDTLRSLLLLNLGIEVGQLSVVAACVALTWWMWRFTWYTRFVVLPMSGGIAGLAGWWTIQRALGW